MIWGWNTRGAASYCSCRQLLYTARMVGVIGNDFGEEYVERLRNRALIEGLQKDETGPPFEGKYHENFNRREALDIQLNVFEKFLPNLPESYMDPSFVLLGNIHLSSDARSIS